MTNEQRKAIEICKEKIIEPFYDFPNPTSIELKDTDVGAIDTVLSLIKEQEKKIENLQKELNEENNRCMILANNDKFKEQVIDLMAEYIEKVTVDLKVAFGENMLWNRNEIKQYFADLVEKE